MFLWLWDLFINKTYVALCMHNKNLAASKQNIINMFNKNRYDNLKHIQYTDHINIT